MSLPPDPPRLTKTLIFTLKSVQAYQTISQLLAGLRLDQERLGYGSQGQYLPTAGKRII
jgi:hypothetical protein